MKYWPLLIFEWGGKVGFVGKTEEKPAVWEVWEQERN